MALVRKRLGEILLEAGMITDDQLESALTKQQGTTKTLGQILVDAKFVTESNIKDALELQFGISYVNVSSIKLTKELMGLIPENLMKQRQIIPISFNNNSLTIAMVNPQDLPAIDDVRMAVTKTVGKMVNVRPVVITEDDFFTFMNEQLTAQKEEITPTKKGPVGIDLGQEYNTDNIIDELDVEEIDEDFDEEDGDADAAPIVRLGNAILANAIKRGVSDIHIEPQETALRLRYRIDGVLHVEPPLPKRISNALTSRFKIMTDLNIAEKRLPQDGRLRRRIGGRNIDFRVSTLPSKYGEKIVMRILDNSNTQLGLEILFCYPELLLKIRELVQRPYGIIFVTGPTGSGKTTSLYSILGERNTPDVNISTAEDPIEYDLAGIIQTQAQPKIGLTFARILKAFLRQDPDIMLIGETRDAELAHIAIESALTGHLVFTSLHTNDAPGSITRLMEMKLPGFLISSSTVMVLAQRLVRRLCQDCKVEYEPDAATLKYIGYPFKNADGSPVKVHKHNTEGCEKCSSGYKGRMGAYELMTMNDELRELINKEATKDLLRIASRKNGMVTLLEFSLCLVRDGFTDIDEVVRVTLTDEGLSDPIPVYHYYTLDGEGVDITPDGRVVTPKEAAELRGLKYEPPAKKGAPPSSAPASGEPALDAAVPTNQVEAGVEKLQIEAPKAQKEAEEGQCPSCLATVEPEWDTCPYCFTSIN